MGYEHQASPDSPMVFVGSAEKIAEDKAMVSEFRKQHGMSADPHGAVVGTPEEVEHKLALLRRFKRTL